MKRDYRTIKTIIELLLISVLGFIVFYLDLNELINFLK